MNVVDLPFDPERVSLAAALRAGNVVSGEIMPVEFADDALALQFSTKHGDDLRYVAAWGRWMTWTGTIWEHDSTLYVYDKVRRICRTAAAEARLPTLQTKLSAARTASSVELMARSDRRHAATIDQWDSDPWLLNTPGGVVDLRTGRTHAANPDWHMTRCTAIAPDETAHCPTFMTFLDRITGGNVLLQAYLQRVAGYCLTGITKEHAMFFGYGTGGNGKGVYLNTIVSIMATYAVTADPDTFTAQKNGRHLTELARLMAARFVVSQETEEGKPWAEARIKSVTGGDPITANFMRQDHFTFTPQFKLFMAGNHKPGIQNVDEAMRRRMNLIPFDVTIPKEERDADLPQKLRAEWPGILRWMIAGCLDWQQVGLRQPATVTSATDEYFESEDALGMWMAESCVINHHSDTQVMELFTSWSAWAKNAGEEAGSKKRFSQKLTSRGFALRKATGGIRMISGIRLMRPKNHNNQDEM